MTDRPGRRAGADHRGPPSLDEQLSARRKKYLIMMCVRVVCLVLAAAFYRTPWLLAIFVAGAVALPWMAVLIANDRPPKKALKVNRFGGHPRPGPGHHCGPERRKGHRRLTSLGQRWHSMSGLVLSLRTEKIASGH